MLESKPSRAVALVVGVDHYGFDDERWSLAGPASDALKYVDWLMKRGVQPESIALFLSERSWKDDVQVTKWVAANEYVAHGKLKTGRRARRDEIVEFVDKKLPYIVADAIFIYWGGHGVVDNKGARNCLFTEDAADGAPYCVCVQDLMWALKSPRFSHLKEQITIIDACSTPFSDIRETALLSRASFAMPETPNYDIKQFQMLAAAAGKAAANISERKTGLFSEVIYKELLKHQGNGWPDFHDAFNATLTGVEGLNLGLQQPFLIVDWADALYRSGRPPGDSHLVMSLLPLVNATGASPGLLYRLYLRSLPDSEREVGKASIKRWMEDLCDSRPKEINRPSPLIEFAERLGREVKDSGLRKWVVDNTEDNRNARTALCNSLDAEEKSQRSKATLFMEISADQHNLRWWLDAPDLKDCGVVKGDACIQGEIKDVKNLKDQVAAHLQTAMTEAESRVGNKYVFVVSFIVPDALLLSGLESTMVVFEEDDLPSDITPLNECYPVTLHWQKRAIATSEGGGRTVNAWKKALETLAPRILANGAADVVWFEAAPDEDYANPFSVVTTKLLSAEGTGICVGLGHLIEADPGKPVKEIIGCLKEGVPCFFWLAKPPGANTDARKSLCNLFSQQKASEAPLAIGKLRKLAKRGDPLSSICMVWDEPGYLPSMQRFEGPTQGDTT